MENNETPLTIKVAFSGDFAADKSSIIKRLNSDIFDFAPSATIGIEFTNLTSDDGKLKYQLWNRVGGKRFMNMAPAYYKKVDIVVLVYDITNAESFKNMDKYYSEACQICKDRMPEILVIGNKNDLAIEREVSQDEAEKWSVEKNSFLYGF